MIGIGIDSDTAIVLTGRKIQALGSGSATFLTMANQRQPLRIKTIRQRQSRRTNPAEYMVDLTAWRRDAIDRKCAGQGIGCRRRFETHRIAVDPDAEDAVLLAHDGLHAAPGGLGTL